MTEYHDAAHEAHARLLMAQEYRADPRNREELVEKEAELRKAEVSESRRKRMARFRASIA